MNPRAFLQHLSDLRVCNDVLDWSDATNAHVYSAWNRWTRNPLHLIVDENRKITLEGFVMQDLRDKRPLLSLLGHRTAANAATIVCCMGSDICNLLGIDVIGADFPSGDTQIARLNIPVDEANKLAREARLPIRFVEGLSASRAWELKVQSGETSGMDDPVWISMTQEKIDTALLRCWFGDRTSRGDNE